MKNIRQMSFEEIEAELQASRDRDKAVALELDKLISFAQEVKAKLCNDQISLNLPIKTTTKKKSMPQRIVELIKGNDGKFTSTDIYNFFVSDGTYSDFETSKRNIPSLLSRMNGEYITHESNGEPWKWIKDHE